MLPHIFFQAFFSNNNFFMNASPGSFLPFLASTTFTLPLLDRSGSRGRRSWVCKGRLEIQFPLHQALHYFMAEKLHFYTFHNNTETLQYCDIYNLLLHLQLPSLSLAIETQTVDTQALVTDIFCINIKFTNDEICMVLREELHLT